MKPFDLSRWSDGGDMSHYAFLHMTEFFPHALIARNGPVSPLETNWMPEVGEFMVETIYGKLALSDFIQRMAVDGFLVLHRGKIVYETYPRMSPLDKHMWMSLSKTLTGGLVALLEDRGVLDVQRPVENYLPELKGSGWEGVSVLDVLDMTSGIDASQNDDPQVYAPGAPMSLFNASMGWGPMDESTPSSTYDYISTLKRKQVPGQAFQYSDVNTFVAGWLVERLTGNHYVDLVREEIWSHLGAEGEAFHCLSPNGAAVMHAGMYSSLHDLGRYGLLYTPSWSVVSQKKVFSDAYIERIQRRGRPEIFDKGVSGKLCIWFLNDQPLANTFQWDAVMETGDFMKAGRGGQGLWISPNLDLVVAQFGHESLAILTMRYISAMTRAGLFSS
jgi:CubicO group peptidase (beta-lactamase class C family)